MNDFYNPDRQVNKVAENQRQELWINYFSGNNAQDRVTDMKRLEGDGLFHACPEMYLLCFVGLPSCHDVFVASAAMEFDICSWLEGELDINWPFPFPFRSDSIDKEMHLAFHYHSAASWQQALCANFSSRWGIAMATYLYL